VECGSVIGSYAGPHLVQRVRRLWSVLNIPFLGSDSRDYAESASGYLGRIMDNHLIHDGCPLDVSMPLNHTPGGDDPLIQAVMVARI